MIYHVNPEARGLNISPVSNFLEETERIMQGKYEVLKVYREEKLVGGSPRTFLNIDVRQIGTFVKESR